MKKIKLNSLGYEINETTFGVMISYSSSYIITSIILTLLGLCIFLPSLYVLLDMLVSVGFLSNEILKIFIISMFIISGFLAFYKGIDRFLNALGFKVIFSNSDLVIESRVDLLLKKQTIEDVIDYEFVIEENRLLIVVNRKDNDRLELLETLNYDSFKDVFRDLEFYLNKTYKWR